MFSPGALYGSGNVKKVHEMLAEGVERSGVQWGHWGYGSHERKLVRGY
jgi:hypothetical protein